MTMTMKRVLIFLLLSLPFLRYHAQCTIDYSYTQPGIYPNPFPTAYAGQAYNQDVTFVMPLDTMGATIQNFEIISVGLPVGLSWVCDNSANGCNYNPQNNQYGCINVYGTPLVTGQYDVEVRVLVDVTSSGQTIDNVPVVFDMDFTVDNATVGNSGFISSPYMGCYPLQVNFTNNNPGLLVYDWDFGNGQTSTLENPPTQTYNLPGEYVVNYTAYANLDTVDVYTLTDVTIHSITGGWGPEYIPFLYTNNKPDPYFIVKENGNLIYQSSFVLNDNGPNTWQVNINLDPDSNYTLEVWDADQTAASANQYELVFGSDDYIGTHNINFISCSQCSAGGDATVSTLIGYQQVLPVPANQSVDTVRVGTTPGTPNIVYDSSNYIVFTDSSNYILQWHLDSFAQPGQVNPVDSIFTSGNYHVVAYNSFGCSSSSDTIYITYCDPTVSFDLGLDGAFNLYITNLTAGHSIEWFVNGQLDNTVTGNLYTPSINGDYQARLTSIYGCKYFTNIYSFNSVGVISKNEDYWIYPNPVQNELTLLWPSSRNYTSIQILDLNGRLVKSVYTSSSPQKISTSQLENGIYFIYLTHLNGNSTVSRFTIQH